MKTQQKVLKKKEKFHSRNHQLLKNHHLLNQLQNPLQQFKMVIKEFCLNMNLAKKLKNLLLNYLIKLLQKNPGKLNHHLKPFLCHILMRKMKVTLIDFSLCFFLG